MASSLSSSPSTSDVRDDDVQVSNNSSEENLEMPPSRQSKQDDHGDTEGNGDEDQDAPSESTAETSSMQARKEKLEKLRAKMVRLLIPFDPQQRLTPLSNSENPQLRTANRSLRSPPRLN